MEPSIFDLKLDQKICNDIIHEFITNSKLKLLDTSKTTFDIFEKFIYETACYHIKNIEINDTVNISDYYIEFWTKPSVHKNKNKKNTLNNFHVDCDEVMKDTMNNVIHPILSCVTYLDDSEFPVLLTDINMEEYKFKNFDNKNTLKLYFPRKNSQIVFDGSKFHGVIDIFNRIYDEEEKEIQRNIIAINLWKIKPTNIEYYESNCDYIYDNNDNIIKSFLIDLKKETIQSNVKFEYDFYEEMLYRSSKFKFADDIVESVKKIYENDDYMEIISITTKMEKRDFDKEKNLKKLFLDVDFMNKLSNEDDNDKNEYNKNIINNRFLQRMIYHNFYTKEICEWIINSSETYALNNGGWTTQRHKNYPTTDIPLEKVKDVFNFVIFSFNNLFQKIKKFYSLGEYIHFNISDLFIAKYDSETQNELEIHRDGSFFSFNILLSNANDFEGGGTCFEDGITVNLDQGDVIVHNGQIKHRGNKITKGTRYILVSFVSIIIECSPDDIEK